MEVLLPAAVAWVLGSAWGRRDLVWRLCFVSLLPQYLYNMLDRGSLDFRIIGGRDGERNIRRGSDGAEPGNSGVECQRWEIGQTLAVKE